MRKIVLFILLYLFCSYTYAQNEFRNSITARSKALLFEFSGFSNIAAGNFEGGIGGKYFLNNNMGIRASLQFATASSDLPANPGAGQGGIDGDVSATQFGISGALEYHFGIGRVSPYLGGGLGFSTTSTTSKQPVTGPLNAQLVQVEVKNRIGGENINGTTFTGGTSFRIFGELGVELFLFREFSLSAEYRLGFVSASQADQEITANNTTETTTGPTTTAFGIDSQGFITMAIYF